MYAGYSLFSYFFFFLNRQLCSVFPIVTDLSRYYWKTHTDEARFSLWLSKGVPVALLVVVRTHPTFPLNHIWLPQRRVLLGIGMTSGLKTIWGTNLHKVLQPGNAFAIEVELEGYLEDIWSLFIADTKSVYSTPHRT